MTDVQATKLMAGLGMVGSQIPDILFSGLTPRSKTLSEAFRSGFGKYMLDIGYDIDDSILVSMRYIKLFQLTDRIGKLVHTF